MIYEPENTHLFKQDPVGIWPYGDYLLFDPIYAFDDRFWSDVDDFASDGEIVYANVDGHMTLLHSSVFVPEVSVYNGNQFVGCVPIDSEMLMLAPENSVDVSYIMDICLEITVVEEFKITVDKDMITFGTWNIPLSRKEK